jgi:hypothetical protein
MNNYCKCGYLIENGKCTRKKKTRECYGERTKIGKYSGKSKTPYGEYENR